MTTSTCHLCLKEKPLLKKSHIIPDFMHQDLFDANHKLNRFAPASYASGNHRIERPSSGEYESDILCKVCDNEVIGSYETYGERVLYAKSIEFATDVIVEHGVTEKGTPVTRFTNVDYRNFKLFLLSILWRASISKRNFFRAVSLGPYEERIRKMILDGNPETKDEFPILMISWMLNEPSWSHQVGEPGKNRATSGIRYVFIIAGITYVFHVSPASMDPTFMPFTILPTNTFSILYIPQGKGEQLFRRYYDV